MPLKAFNRDTNEFVYSGIVDKKLWDKWKISKEYSFICPNTECNTSFVLVTNHKGTQFFRHKSNNDCPFNSKGITEEHYYLQNLVLESLLAFGFDMRKDRSILQENEVDVEVMVENRRTDVICNHKGNKYIFEIQWSKQTDQKYIERQHDYLDQGIKEIYWICRHSPYLIDIPYVTLKEDLSDVNIRKDIYSSIPSFIFDIFQKKWRYTNGKWITKDEFIKKKREAYEKGIEQEKEKSLQKSKQRYYNKNREKLAIERVNLSERFNQAANEYWSLLPKYKKKGKTKEQYILSFFEKEGYPADSKDYENYQIQAVIFRIEYLIKELLQYI